MKTGFRIGSLAQDAVDGIKCLEAAASAARYDSVETPMGVDYQVPAGKTFYITKFYYGNADAGGTLVIGYGDDAKDNDVNPPANWKEMTAIFFNRLADEQYFADVFIPIPATKYPAILGGAGTMRVTIFGIEITN